MVLLREEPLGGIGEFTSELLAALLPEWFSYAGVTRKSGNTRKFQAIRSITKSVGILVNVRRGSHGFGVAKFPPK